MFFLLPDLLICKMITDPIRDHLSLGQCRLRAENLTVSIMYLYHDEIGLQTRNKRNRHKQRFILFELNFTACRNDIFGIKLGDLQLGALILFFFHLTHLRYSEK